MSPSFAFTSRAVLIHISSSVKGFSFNPLLWLDGFGTQVILPACPREMSRALSILFRCANSVESENMGLNKPFALKTKGCLQWFTVTEVTQWSLSTVSVHLIQREVLERSDNPLLSHCPTGHRIIGSIQVCKCLVSWLAQQDKQAVLVEGSEMGSLLLS